MKHIIFYILLYSNVMYSFQAPVDYKTLLPPAIMHILDTLPIIQGSKDDSLDKKAKHITDIILYAYPNKNTINDRDLIEDKIKQSMSANTPITGYLPGYPISSDNPNKIASSFQPLGLGEFIGLYTLHHICSQIKQLYEPGMIITIYWEPYINDINKIVQSSLGFQEFPNKRIKEYRTALKLLVTLFPSITIASKKFMEKLYKENENQEIIIDSSLTPFYTTFFQEDLDNPLHKEIIEETILRNKSQEIIKQLQLTTTEELTGTYIKHLEQSKDQKNKKLAKTIKNNLKVSSVIKDVASQVARIVQKGSKIESITLDNIIKDNDNHALRLSVRIDESSVKNKIGIPPLYPSTKMPWHNTIAVKKSNNTIIVDSYDKIIKKNKDSKPKNIEIKFGKEKICLGYLQID